MPAISTSSVVLRQLAVAAEALLRARGELPTRHAEHDWATLREVVIRRPDLGETLLDRCQL